MDEEYVFKIPIEAGAVTEVLEDELEHYGMPRRSGRYPWGSGNTPYQHGGPYSANDFVQRINELKSEGVTSKEIADYFGVTTTALEHRVIAKNEIRNIKVDTAKALKEKGLTHIK